MSGRERLAQVREALQNADDLACDQHGVILINAAKQQTTTSTRLVDAATEYVRAALAALDGCVLLTAEEAREIAAVVHRVRGFHYERMDALYALLGAETTRDEAKVLADLAQEKADRLLKDLP